MDVPCDAVFSCLGSPDSFWTDMWENSKVIFFFKFALGLFVISLTYSLPHSIPLSLHFHHILSKFNPLFSFYLTCKVYSISFPWVYLSYFLCQKEVFAKFFDYISLLFTVTA